MRSFTLKNFCTYKTIFINISFNLYYHITYIIIYLIKLILIQIFTKNKDKNINVKYKGKNYEVFSSILFKNASYSGSS
jgi:hypothetical protein